MMFFKFVLIFVIMTIQNSNSFRKSAEIPGDCKDVECIAKLLRGQLKKEITTPSGKRKLLLNTQLSLKLKLVYFSNDPCFASLTCEFCKVINEILKPSLDNLLKEGSGDTEVGEEDKHHPTCRWVRCCSPWKDGPEPKNQNPEDYKG